MKPSSNHFPLIAAHKPDLFLYPSFFCLCAGIPRVSCRHSAKPFVWFYEVEQYCQDIGFCVWDIIREKESQAIISSTIYYSPIFTSCLRISYRHCILRCESGLPSFNLDLITFTITFIGRAIEYNVILRSLQVQVSKGTLQGDIWWHRYLRLRTETRNHQSE